MPLPAEWAEYLAKMEKDIKRAPGPIRRHQPRIRRMTSPRQRIAESQQRNSVKASYSLDFVSTPTVPNDKPMIWPKDMKRPNWSTGKSTKTR